LRKNGLETGQQVVITAGVPFQVSGHTNLVNVHDI